MTPQQRHEAAVAWLRRTGCRADEIMVAALLEFLDEQLADERLERGATFARGWRAGTQAQLEHCRALEPKMHFSHLPTDLVPAPAVSSSSPTNDDQDAAPRTATGASELGPGSSRPR